jgi:hypothetical protein
MDKLLVEINNNGQQFIKDYFGELTSLSLTEADELKLIEVSIRTIKADDKIEYSEIKFFKVIRSKLKIENKLILEKHPDFEEYLEQDIISDSYLSRIQNDYLFSQDLPELKLINEDILKTNDKKDK